MGRPTRWGNPYVVGEGELSWSGEIRAPSAGRYGLDNRTFWASQLPLSGGITAAQAVELYRADLDMGLEEHVDDHPEDRERTFELRGALAGLADADLACWCDLDAPCHADVLLELANEGR